MSRSLLILFLALFATSSGWAADAVNWKKVKVLVYTKNGKGYVHDNIASAVAAIQKAGTRTRFQKSTYPTSRLCLRKTT